MGKHGFCCPGRLKHSVLKGVSKQMLRDICGGLIERWVPVLLCRQRYISLSIIQPNITKSGQSRSLEECCEISEAERHEILAMKNSILWVVMKFEKAECNSTCSRRLYCIYDLTWLRVIIDVVQVPLWIFWKTIHSWWNRNWNQVSLLWSLAPDSIGSPCVSMPLAILLS